MEVDEIQRIRIWEYENGKMEDKRRNRVGQGEIEVDRAKLKKVRRN